MTLRDEIPAAGAPRPRSPVADRGLTRPDWTTERPRSPEKLWLDKNENVDPALAELTTKLLREVAGSPNYTYPESGSVYRKLARSLGVGPENLVLTAGSDGAIRSVFEAYIEPGDVVLHTAPTFAMYPVYCAMYGARAIALAYRPSNDGPRLDADDLIGAIRRERPRLVCLPNPDSPTGTVFSSSDLRAIVDEAGHAGAVILVDEAYYLFSPQTALPWIAECPHLVVARSTGKAWGMAGFRIGYACGAPEIIGYLHKVRPMYETSTIAVALFERMLDHEDEVRASVRRLEAGKLMFLDSMRRLGFRTLAGQGNFCHVAFGARAEVVHSALADLVYYRKDFADPCLAGFSRFSSATREQFQPIIARIESACAGAVR